MARELSDGPDYSGLCVGDRIDCASDAERALIGSSLESAGFTVEADGLRLTITGVPEDEYVVQAFGKRPQLSYCSTEAEAEEVFEDIRASGIYEHIEILKGYPGHWALVRRWDHEGMA